MNGDNQPQPAPPEQPAPPAGQWQYNSSQEAAPAPYRPPVTSDSNGQLPQEEQSTSEFEWTGSEFIAHSKGPGWYAAFVAIGLLVVILAYFMTRDGIATFLVAAIVIIFGIAANRPPRTLTYRILPQGVYIGRRYYSYSEYKSFSIVDEGAFSSIVFWPLKRFSMPIGIYYDPNNEDQIITTLATHLPMQAHQIDLVERAMRAIRF